MSQPAENPERAQSRELLRLLHGELPPEREARLRRRIQADPRLGEEFARLERVWASIADAPPVPTPPDLAARIVARLEPARGSGGAGLGLPMPARFAAAAALLVGALLGVTIGQQLHVGTASAELVAEPSFESLELQDSLAGAFWDWSETIESGATDPHTEEAQ